MHSIRYVINFTYSYLRRKYTKDSHLPPERLKESLFVLLCHFTVAKKLAQEWHKHLGKEKSTHDYSS